MNNNYSNKMYDAIVIGSGSGGLTAAVGLSRFGKRVLMLERSRVGGDCTNFGCIPSKSLLHLSAKASDGAGTSKVAPETTAELLKRVRQRRDDLEAHERDEFGSMEGIDLVFGTATVTSANTVTVSAPDATHQPSPATAGGSIVDPVTYRADHIVIATGSSPRRIPIPGLPDDMYLTNEELFEQEAVPERLVIVGAGPIGLEMAVAFNRLGSRVTVLDAAAQILPGLLPDAAEVLTRALEAQGVELKPGLAPHRFQAANRRLEIGPLGEDPTDGLDDVDAVLVAVGRVPNSSNLGLGEVGVATTDGGQIIIDDKGRTNIEGVWAVGDVTIEGGTTHMANAWGRRLIQAIALPYLPLKKRPVRPAVTYTSPEVATIGDQPEVPAADVRRITVDLSATDRAYTDEADHGILIVDVRKLSGQVLGATIVGPRAGDLIAMFSLAMANDIAFHKWYGTVIPYPTYGDAVTQAVDTYISETFPNAGTELAAWAQGRFRALRTRLDRA